MKKIIPIFLILSTLFMPSNAIADELTLPTPPVISNEQDIGPVISPMKKGDKAIFTGLLLSPRATATIIAQINANNAQIKLEVDKTKNEENSKCDFRVSEQKINFDSDKSILQAQIRTQQNDIFILSNKIADYEKSGNNNNFWLGTGFAAGIITTLATVFIVTRISN